MPKDFFFFKGRHLCSCILILLFSLVICLVHHREGSDIINVVNCLMLLDLYCSLHQWPLSSIQVHKQRFHNVTIAKCSHMRKAGSTKRRSRNLQKSQPSLTDVITLEVHTRDDRSFNILEQQFLGMNVTKVSCLRNSLNKLYSMVVLLSVSQWGHLLHEFMQEAPNHTLPVCN